MQAYTFKKIKNNFLNFLFIASTCTLPLSAAETPKEKINEWISSIPYIGLIADEVTYGPISLKHFHLEGQDRGRNIVFAKPGEIINGTVRYKIKADEKELNKHHIILGIKGQDAQSCITHSLGAKGKKGKAKFSLVAPAEKGYYEVRFDYQTTTTCNDAIALWKEETPSAKATVGLIIVE